MTWVKQNKKRFLGGFMLVLFVGTFVVSSFSVANQATAADNLATAEAAIRAGESAGVTSGNPALAAGDVLEVTSEKLVHPPLKVVLKTVLINLLSFVLNRLAYDLAVFMASGGQGQTPNFQYKSADEYFADLGMDVVGAHMDALNGVLEEIDVNFNVCAPEDPSIRMGIQLGIRSAYSRPEPKCDIRDAMNNWDSYIGSIQERFQSMGENPSDFVLNEFKKVYRPGSNELSASFSIIAQVQNEATTTKNISFLENLFNQGYSPVTDAITGQVETPADIIQRKTQQELVDAQGDQTKMNWDAIMSDSDLLVGMGMSAASVFLNTLLSELLNNIYTGVFDVELVEEDIFSGNYASVGGREAAEEKYRDLLSVEIISLDSFSPVTELLACPGSTSRGIFNCAMDAAFATAVTAAETGEPMTVQEAIDDGIMHGNWPLIPPDDYAKNQDPYCYTYGYCYANLVKLRKFRIIPVGWEMAAASIYNSKSNPVTLQEVVDSFDDCSVDGKANANHPWCHLIDPNWVLKAPETYCPAAAPGELLISSSLDTRQSYCMDTPSCIATDDQGNCIGGQGYCTREKNVWSFRGDECPEQYSSCLSFKNIDTNETASWLLNTVDFDACNEDNAGCMWYRTNKYFDGAGTTDTTDDGYEWLATGDDYVVADRDADVESNITGPGTYSYDTNGDGTDDVSYEQYAYEDRIYMTGDVVECDEADAGCTELVAKTDETFLNLVANSSFETDINGDNEPDFWYGLGAASDYHIDDGGSLYGFDYLEFGATTTDMYQEVKLSPSAFYTLSFFVTDPTASSMDGSVLIEVYDESGVEVSLTGTTILGDCAQDDVYSVITEFSDVGSDWTRKTCTFTAPADTDYIMLKLEQGGGSFYIDAVQLEEGSVAHDFQEEYGSSNVNYSYYKLPPDYLGCTGATSDPDECSDYVRMCSAQDVGCNMYYPEDGDPEVPAIVTELDVCPDECVGYDTYKQESTLYDDSEFPLYFIPSTAASCDETSVGCDEFTNLDEVAEGGEGLEYYTYLRACTDPADTTEAATFFTWEGSDQSGYQLVSWDLVESNFSSSSLTLVSGFTEDDVGNAPCVNPVMSDESTLICQDQLFKDEDGAIGTAAIFNNTACDEHDDIFSNPDCREFYDSEGGIHYREFSLTATVTEDCSPYRKSESAQTDCTNSGGFWTPGGECRYLGYADESTSCSSSANGCRSYTGGAGRNATTIFYDEVEDGSLNEWNTASATISNDSVVADGHSIFMPTGGARLETLYIDENIAATTCPTDDICTIVDPLTGASCDIFGTDENDYCGALTGALVQGKTYILSFWAKGNGSIAASLVDHGGADDSHSFQSDAVELSGSWQLYTMGPLDTSDANDFQDFDDSAVLKIYNADSELFYIDNIQLKEVEDNITLIKDSWVTPASCDESPAGADSAQYYLGCEAYTDRDGEDWSLYRFTNLCSDDAIGCAAFYDTQNSSSAYAEVHNATCSAIDFNNSSLFTPDGDGTPEAGEGYCTLDPTIECSTHTGCVLATLNVNARCVAYTPTACEIDGENVCTIGVGDSVCRFDWDGNLPVSKPDNIWLAPETQVVPNDEIVYLIEDNAYSCSSSAKGCTEVGLPDFNQDKSEVESFESVYLLDQPDNYNTLLCEHRSLFCEAWSTNEDGNYYFKHPVDQTCEWKEAVTINNDDYTGWFKTGTTEPCYTDYLISGDEYGIWRNGDLTYDGWVGECGVQYDRCTEFVDVMDVEEGGREDGTPYYYLRNDQIAESEVPDSQKCNGQVSQRYGCALFNDTSDSNLLYNAGASYVVSAHADQLFGDAPHSLQTPIDCDNEQGGEIVTVGNNTIDVCTQRCEYDVYVGVNLPAGTVSYGNSCIVNDDCPIITDDYQNEITGECVSGVSRLDNDVNVIQKVYRDRECAEWITCVSESYSWDERLGAYRGVCSGVSACNEYSAIGDTAFCVGFPENDPEPLTLEEYSARDVTWFGRDYSGYSIPQLIPAEFLTEININPNMACVNDSLGWITNNAFGWPAACSEETDCDQYEGTGATYTCKTVDPDIRMGYQAGGCSVENGDDCAVGVCEDSGESCLTDVDCTTGSCLIGFCEVSNLNSTCTTDSYCATNFSPYSSCVNGICTQVTTTSCSTDDQCGTDLDSDGDGDIDIDYECDITSGAFVGTCINGACSVDQYGTTFNIDTSETLECRGYPEQTAPYPQEVVDEWKSFDCTDVDHDGVIEKPEECDISHQSILANVSEDGVPEQTRSGYDNVNVCGVNNEDCLCSYDKATYGNGSETRYYEYGTSRDDAMEGVCFSGAYNGLSCSNDDECGSSGSCMTLDGWDSYLGWEGFCLERDTAMNRWGDANGPGVCLTWLPVDQFAGSTDIYAKNEEAGFPLEDAYYCAEGTYFRDYYTTGVRMNSDGTIKAYDGNPDNIEVACSESISNQLLFDAAGDGCDSAYSACWYNAYCPDGYTAVVGKMRDDTDDDTTLEYLDNVCTDEHFYGSADDDCPYICVPNNAYRYDTGESCDDILYGTNIFSPSELFEGDDENCRTSGTLQDPVWDYPDTSIWGTPVRLIYSIEAAFEDIYSSNDDETFAEGGDRHLERCVARGIPVRVSNADEIYEDVPYDASSVVHITNGDIDSDCLNRISKHRAGDVQCLINCDDSGDWDDNYEYFIWSNLVDWSANPGLECDGSNPDRGFWRLSFTSVTPGGNHGAFTEYIGCYEIAQMANEDGNKAFTNRIWLSNPDIFTAENITDGYDDVRFTPIDIPIYAGESLFNDYYDETSDGSKVFELASGVTPSGALDAFPLPLYTYDSSSSLSTHGDGLISSNPADTSAQTYNYPGEAQIPLTLELGDDPWGLGWLYEKLTLEDEDTALSHNDIDVYQLVDEYGSSATEPGFSSVSDLIGQFFAKSYELLLYSWNGKTIDGDAYNGEGECDGGCYVSFEDEHAPIDEYIELTDYSDHEELDNYGDTEANDSVTTAPYVMGVGACFGTLCKEDSDPDENLFTLNEKIGGSIYGEQFKHVIMKFFFSTDTNQFPIRTLKVDWGDGSTIGSETNDNYYKAHRGLEDTPGNETTTYCDTNSEWGMTSESCDPSYFTFNHDYVCSSTTYQSTLDECIIEPSPLDGRPMVLNSPCQGGAATTYGASATACIFQPRLYIKDNWGYCTGYCEGDPAGELCYDDGANGGDNECDLGCPALGAAEGCDAIGAAAEYPNYANPWIYYNGLVEVEPD